MARTASSRSTTSTRILMQDGEQVVETMGAALSSDPRAEDPADRLLEESWPERQRKAARREVVVEMLAAVLFLAVAVPLGLPALLAHHFDVSWALLLTGLYALIAGAVAFPVGAGYLVPTYVILVPMLLLLPPAMVPLLAAAAWLLASLGRVAARRGRPEQILSAVPNAWHAVGPAVVLAVFGTHHSTAPTAVIYLAAFVSG